MKFQSKTAAEQKDSKATVTLPAGPSGNNLRSIITIVNMGNSKRENINIGLRIQKKHFRFSSKN